jgi:hypothetical protein
MTSPEQTCSNSGRKFRMVRTVSSAPVLRDRCPGRLSSVHYQWPCLASLALCPPVWRDALRKLRARSCNSCCTFATAPRSQKAGSLLGNRRVSWVGDSGIEPVTPQCERAAWRSLAVVSAGQKALLAGSGRYWSARLLHRQVSVLPVPVPRIVLSCPVRRHRAVAQAGCLAMCGGSRRSRMRARSAACNCLLTCQDARLGILPPRECPWEIGTDRF